jgi:uncharacterized membrane protein YphA (DoxX/SURF4 family)
MGGRREAREQGEPMSVTSRLLARRSLVRSAQVVVGLLLAWAGLAKLGDISTLVRDIHNFRLLPVAGENLIAIVLPWIELMVALSMLLGIRPRAGAVVATGLMLVVTTAVVLALVRGLSIECGCFGTAGAGRVGTAKLFENAGILAVAAAGVLRPHPAPGGSGDAA